VIEALRQNGNGRLQLERLRSEPGSCVMAEMAEMLEEVAAGKARPVVLIEGDEYLARTSARELADAIRPEKDRALNLVILDAAAGAREIASHLVTGGDVPGPKAVLVEGADASPRRWMRRGALASARPLAGKAAARRARRLLKLGAAGGLGSGGGGVRLERPALRRRKWRKEIGDAPEEADRGGCRSFPPGAGPRTSPRHRTIWRCWSGRWSGAFLRRRT